MTLFAQVNGKRQTFKQRAVGTSYVTLVTAPEKVWTLDSVLAANITASPADFTLEIFDGTNATTLIPAYEVAAKTPYPFKDHNITLGPSDILRVKSSVVDSFDVTAIGFEAMTAV